jgi:hypothetical protein
MSWDDKERLFNVGWSTAAVLGGATASTAASGLDSNDCWDDKGETVASKESSESLVRQLPWVVGVRVSSAGENCRNFGLFLKAFTAADFMVDGVRLLLLHDVAVVIVTGIIKVDELLLAWLCWNSGTFKFGFLGLRN